MRVYLAGTGSRPYVLELCEYILRARMENGPSFAKFIGGGMDVYLAGGISGNLFPEWKKIVNGGGTNMKIYLAGEHPVKNGKFATGGGQLILESFYYCQKNEVITKLLPALGGFLLDSGAFSFITGNAGICDWDKYTEDYAAYINQYNIEHYIEMDLDALIPLSEVERLREKLITLTEREPIVVWHATRGMAYYKDMVKRYKYVAIATTLKGKEGIVWRQRPELMKYFIDLAHDTGAQIHGLGFTALEMLRYLHFDSVDSTAWLYGNRAGYLYQFDPFLPGFMRKINTPPGHRLKSREAAMYNFLEWIKFQEYAKSNL